MNVSCSECQSVYRIDPAKVPTGGIRARCEVCGAVIRIAGDPASANADFARSASPLFRNAPVATPAAGPSGVGRPASSPAMPPAEAPVARPTPTQRVSKGFMGIEPPAPAGGAAVAGGFGGTPMRAPTPAAVPAMAPRAPTPATVPAMAPRAPTPAAVPAMAPRAPTPAA
ncbi:MAG: zinc-ribbon domain-containing protein, partial [Gemmatimonadota bacterium]